MFRLLFALLFSVQAIAQSTMPIIPAPKEWRPGEGQFSLDKNTVIVAPANSFEATYLRDCLRSQYGLKLSIRETAPSKTVSTIRIMLAPSDTLPEHYYLGINRKSIDILAGTTSGQFYAIQTLLQLLPQDPSKTRSVPCLSISDAPKFAWRGMHLDVARHFFPVAFVKKYIDYLASCKMNTFHWHLTDDQGWRIEIKRYPKLTQVGAWRKGTMAGHYNEQRYDSIRYGGFYTQEQIREVVAYASKRHITVVPEIEMPGHAVAALAAYPELSCSGGPFDVERGWGVFDDVFCPKEATFAFLENVLDEVLTLFPSTYIHIGGDECPKTRWKSCPECQAKIRALGLADEHALQSYFVTRIEKYLNSKGRKIIGWDEILEGGLAPNAAVMSWRGTEGGLAAARLKHPVVMSPGSHCYFDQYQADPKTQPLAIGGLLTLEKVYNFNPIPDGLAADAVPYILGAQANVWTEYIPDAQQVEYMIFPRIFALSEVLWGTAKPDAFAAFRERVNQRLGSLDRDGVHYFKPPAKN